MSDGRKYYCFCEANCKFETMTKEQILAAIAQAAETGLVFDSEAAFITKVKESNAGGMLTFWVGTQAEYNAIHEKDPNCYYHITNSTKDADIARNFELLESYLQEHMANGNNPHRVTAKQVGAAAAGFGYGEPMAWLGFDANAWAATGTFQADLEAMFSAMPQGSCKQVQFVDENLNTQKLFGTLWKYTDDYGVLTANNYSGVMAVKNYYGGKWEPWEWNNPPMVAGVEYRTINRYNKKPVYVKAVELGTLPASGQSAIYYSNAKATVVSYDVYAIASSGNKTNFPIISASGIINGSTFASGYTITVNAHTDLSNRTGYAIVRYTLD